MIIVAPTAVPIIVPKPETNYVHSNKNGTQGKLQGINERRFSRQKVEERYDRIEAR
jgi:hypothetical protein